MKRALVLVLVLMALGLGALWLFWQMRPLSDIADRPLRALPDGALKITAFGTSLTKRNDWPEALEEALVACTGRAVRVTRVAKAGAGSSWGVEALDDVIAGAPDLVLMEFAINDADLRDGVSLGTARAQHAAILQRLARARPEAQVLLMTMSPAHGARGWARPFLARHYGQYRDLAGAYDAGLLDLYPRWRAAPGDVRRFEDGLHPGNGAVRAVVLEPLTKAVAQAMGREDCAPVSQ